jgi:hypothetical protein
VRIERLTFYMIILRISFGDESCREESMKERSSPASFFHNLKRKTFEKLFKNDRIAISRV